VSQIVIVGFGRVGQANAIALCMAGYSVCYHDIAEPDRHYLTRYAETYRRIPRIQHLYDQDSVDSSYIVCIGDKVSSDGEQDITDISSVLDDLKNTEGQVILRSTLLPDKLLMLPFDYYVPEFLRTRSAVEDSVSPSSVVIGRNCPGELPSFLERWCAGARKVFIGTPVEAALIKYLSNLWNAARVAFVNEVGSAIGGPAIVDNFDRISRMIDFAFEKAPYLHYGKAYGGECLPKDLRAFSRWANDAGNSMPLLAGICASNEQHASLDDHSQLPEWFSE